MILQFMIYLILINNTIVSQPILTNQPIDINIIIETIETTGTNLTIDINRTIDILGSKGYSLSCNQEYFNHDMDFKDDYRRGDFVPDNMRHPDRPVNLTRAQKVAQE